MEGYLGVLIVLTSVIGAFCDALPAKWCTLSDAEKTKCEDFKKVLKKYNYGPGIICTPMLHEAECLRKIAKGEVDVISVGDKGIYASGRKAGLKPIMDEKFTSGDAASFFYKSVIVVKKSDTTIQSITDLKNKRSCHTGVMRTVGWLIPMGILYKHAGMTAQDCDNNVKSVAAFFSQSCAPGAYDAYNNPDRDNPPQVCGACADSQCPFRGEKYSGYVGAFRGLVDGRCDVAFVKHSTVPTDAPKNTSFTFSKTEYELLCPNGTRKAVDSWNTCNWATKPFRAIMARKDYDVDSFTTMIDNALAAFGDTGNKQNEFKMFNATKYGGRNLMFSDRTKNLVHADSSDYKKFLGEGYLNSYESFRPSTCSKQFRWCAVGDKEMDKCQEMGYAMAARRMTLDLSCVVGKNTDDCFDLIKNNRADLLTVDGGHLFRGGKYFNLRPISAEVYDTTLDDTSYYAVAVTLKSNTDVNLNNMKGKKTCHTGFERTSGWNVPVGYFVNKGDITYDKDKCNIGGSAAKFFGDMCTPGALEKEYNPSGDHPKKMCALCPQNCQTRGKFSGYTGAVRCLIENQGDVAFVKHTTIQSLISKKPDWLKSLTAGDFELLCIDGRRKPVDQWKSCNLARVPSHAVVTSKARTPEQIRHYQIALERAQLKYNTKDDGTPMDSFFSIFKSSDGASNLLFKDSTKKLKRIQDADYEKFLGQEYLNTVKALDSRMCVGASSTVQVSLAALVVALVVFLLW